MEDSKTIFTDRVGNVVTELAKLGVLRAYIWVE